MRLLSGSAAATKSATLAAVALLTGLGGQMVASAIEPLGLSKRIVGGAAVAEGQNRYAVRLDIKSANSDYLCGGTLLDNNLVVTAAHCMFDSDTNSAYEPQNVAVCYGSVAVAKMTCTTARNITVHSQYNPQTYANDIALIQISALKEGDFATLPIFQGDLPQNTVLRTMGWGKTSDTATTLPTTLMAVDIKVGDPATCRRADSSFKSSDGPEVCSVNALTPGKDSCQGDSGSPAVIQVDGETYLAALTSAGLDLNDPTAATCATSGGIAFYTHVNYFIDFITHVTGKPASQYYSARDNDEESATTSSKSAASTTTTRASLLAAALLAGTCLL
ncbi:hypothetical protein GGI07_004367 [Coemansia sp. Benny D115]|nr:hypothetical protein GGI07_004367 [Coemansia sp. Benny D115]